MDKKIDFDGIFIKLFPEYIIYKDWHLTSINVTEAMKQSIRQALPIILQIAADRATASGMFKLPEEKLQTWVDKQSILNQEEEIIKTLGL